MDGNDVIDRLRGERAKEWERGERGADLLLVRRGHEDGLHVAAHVEFRQQAVAFVQDEVLHLG